MTKTEQMLFDAHKTPVVRLDAVCQHYFGLEPEAANRSAALNRLPVPTWRALDSRKAPRLISIVDLAAFIDATREAAAEEHAKSQL